MDETVVAVVGMSTVQMMYNRGYNMHPCATPAFIFFVHEIVVFAFAANELHILEKRSEQYRLFL